MAVTTTNSRKQYTQGAGGTTTDWPVDFKFSANADLVVITTVDAVDTTLTLDTDYSVTGAGEDAGGTVTIDPPIAAGTRLTIYRETDLDQPTVLPSSGGWFPKVHEAVFDRIVMQLQQLYDAVERSIKLSPTSTDSAADLSVLLESIDENAAAAASSASTATTQAGLANTARIAAELAETNAEAAAASIDPNNLLTKAGNLSGLASVATARSNLGLDTLSRRNRLCNGDFRVDNINAGAAVTPSATGANVYIVDNMSYLASQASNITAQRVASSLTGFPYAEKFTVASAFTPGAADYFLAMTGIEGLDWADLKWGTANAKPATISFTVKVSVAGTYCFSVRNAAGNRCYVFTAALSAGENIVTATIPGDTTGTWPTDGQCALRVALDLGCGSNYETTANTWTAGSYFRVSGAVEFVANAAATYEISGIQIEKGSFATPFEVLPYAQEEAWCQRYHPCIRSSGTADALPGNGPAAGITYVGFTLPLVVASRVAPSGVIVSNGTHFTLDDGVTLTPCTALTFNIAGLTSVQVLPAVASGLTQYRPYNLRFNSASGYIRFTGSEL